MNRVAILGPDGQPIDTSRLRHEEGAPTIGGVRQARPNHPSWGLTPQALGALLANSESVNPVDFFALAADLEQREWHFRSVIGTRKAAIAQLPIRVEPFDESKEAIAHADLMRAIVRAPIFQLALMDMLDALAKGASWTNIVWDTSEKQWMPKAYHWRDPRWFQFDQADLTTPLLLNEAGQPERLNPFGWIYHRPMLVSGIPITGGLARPAAWAWMFKNFDMQAWAIFLEVYGHPLRLGRFPASATPKERRELLNAVTNLGHDAAAIVPESMKVEFVEAKGGSGGGSPFGDHAEYLDGQVSKLVLGQTGTTDANKGGYAVGRVHNDVRQDIERWDGAVLSATVNRDLTKPAIDLNFGPQKNYPLIVIGRPQDKDVKLILTNIGGLVDRGLEVEKSQIYDLIGLSEPKKGAQLLDRAPKPGPQPGGTSPSGRRADNPGGDDPTGHDPDEADPSTLSAEDRTRLTDWAEETVEETLGKEGWVPDTRALRDAIATCSTYEEFEDVLAKHFDKLGLDTLTDLVARLRFNARATGIVGR